MKKGNKESKEINYKKEGISFGLGLNPKKQIRESMNL